MKYQIETKDWKTFFAWNYKQEGKKLIIETVTWSDDFESTGSFTAVLDHKDVYSITRLKDD